jgi:hypothetical protein
MLWPLRLVVAVHTGLTATLSGSGRRRTWLRTAAEVILTAIAELVVASLVTVHAIAPRGLPLLTRCLELLAIGHDDAVVVLSVLQIVLCEDTVAGRLRVARQLQILFCDVRWRSAHLNIGSIRLEAARQRVLAFADMVVAPTATAAAAVVIVATASTAVLLMLTWPHWRVSSHSFSKSHEVSKSLYGGDCVQIGGRL